MRCLSCGFDNPEGNKFCEDCGASLVLTCPSCDSPVVPGRRFCGQCGTALQSTGAEGAGRSATAAGAGPEVPLAERRMCSILFCDLVGFTTLSEQRDPEAVRELLGRYFETARTVISRYGGTVEKFIGDAVMAVWGTPTADENDAEHAVRAAIELTEVVGELGAESHTPTLAARAGVVTGLVAVNIGASGQGMVAGDAVNTAARIQAAAEPGTVLVDEGTRKAAGEAIAFVNVGARELKGKQLPIELWRVDRVLSGVGGSQRVDGLEAQLVGRNAELRLVKELFHASAERRTPRLVSVVGAAGVGKSRIGWEFEKYVDGLVDTVWWHRGRCLSYGDGVAFSALAEMVRRRFGIAEDDPPALAGSKLRDGLPQWLDTSEIAYVQPRLGQLLGVDLGSTPTLSREELFAGWRLFFERLAATGPVVLLVEDLQFADSGMLDFLEHLLDWARDVPLFMLTLSRPEIDARRAGWGTGRGNSTAVSLDPLDRAAMEQLLDGLVPGMSAAAKAAIAGRAEGIPLYAVETVRMLIDREVVQPIDGAYRLVGDIGNLSVPATLHSLLAARLDAFDPDTRRLIADASVLGESFPRDALVATSGMPAEQVDRTIADLVRREVLTVRADPLSPERGQYAFVQTMLRDVARETQSRHDRKTRHLTVAAHLQSAYADGGEEIAEVIAAHLLDALAAVPDATDADELRERAIDMLTRAGRRAERTGAPLSAARSYSRAAELMAEDPGRELEAAALWEKAGDCARSARDMVAIDHFTRAGDIYRRHGHPRDAARADLEVATVIGRTGRRLHDGLRMARAALEVLQTEEDAETVKALGTIAIFEVFAGSPEGERLSSEALAKAQALGMPDERYAMLLNARGLAYITDNRLVEGVAYMREAVVRAEAAQIPAAVCLSLTNLSDALMAFDAPGSAAAARRAVDEARRIGDRQSLSYAGGNLIQALLLAGRWAEAETALREAITIDDLGDDPVLVFSQVVFEALHGQVVNDPERWKIMEQAADSEDAQDWGGLAAVRAITALGDGDPTTALAQARRALEAVDVIGVRADVICWAWPAAADAALELRDLAAADELVAWLDGFPPGHVPPRLHAHRLRTVARLLAARGDAGAAAAFDEAVGALRRTGSPYDAALGLIDQAEFLATSGSSSSSSESADATGAAGELAAEALAIAEELGVQPLADRARRLLPAELSVPAPEPMPS